MAEEVVDTNPDIFPEGEYIFVCNSVVKKLSEKGNKPYYIFKFEGLLDDGIKPYSEFVFPSQAGPLILALGGKESEEKGKFVWDREKVSGNKIKAKIIHELNKKGVLRARIIEPVQELPF